MRRLFKWKLAWSALYTIAGALVLLIFGALYFGLSLDDNMVWVCSGAALVGATLSSRSFVGRQPREILIASLAVGACHAILSSLPSLHPVLGTPGPFNQSLATPFVWGTSALAGSHLGRWWAQRFPFQAPHVAGPLNAICVLLGTFAIHVSLIVIVALLSQRIAIFLCLVALIASPAVAGAALQLGQREPVERDMAVGITLIGIFMLALIGFEIDSISSLLLISIAVVSAGGVVYSITLPGVIVVRAGSRWNYRWNVDLPVAVTLERRQEQALPEPTSELDPPHCKA